MEEDVKVYLPINFEQVIQLVYQLSNAEKQRLLEYLENWQTEAEPTLTHFASEQALAADWSTPEEDEAWADL